MNVFDTAATMRLPLMMAVVLLFSGSVWAGSAPTDAQLFLNEAVQGSVAEVSLGQLAEQQAQNEAVGAFGTRMVNDHSQTLTRARQLASQHGVRLVEQLSQQHKQMAEQLSAKQGSDFDHAYMNAMVEDHRKTVQKFETQANEGSGEIAAFARAQLPVLKEHLAQAQALAGRLK